MSLPASSPTSTVPTVSKLALYTFFSWRRIIASPTARSVYGAKRAISSPFRR